MSDVSKIKIGNTSYNVADKKARSDIDTIYDEISDLSLIKGTTSRNFTNVSTNSTSVRYASYTYQRVGNIVTLNIKIQLNASTGTLKFSGLPFNTQKNSYGVCVSDQNVMGLWLICYDSSVNAAVLQISKPDNSQWAHSSGESINFIATYEV